MNIRIGHGYDVHKLVEGRKCIIGGVDIPCDLGLLGHSDADVLLHAVSDALLGAAALGDIGKHFPDTDERFAGANSFVLLQNVVALLAEKGFKASNIDATIIAQVPKMAPISMKCAPISQKPAELTPIAFPLRQPRKKSSALPVPSRA